MSEAASGRVVAAAALAEAARAALLGAEALARAAAPWPADLARRGLAAPAFRIAALSLALPCLPRSPPGAALMVELLGADRHPPGLRRLVLHVVGAASGAASVAVSLAPPDERPKTVSPGAVSLGAVS